MFIAKKYFETNVGSFKKGAEVPANIATKYPRDCELVKEEITKVVEKVVEELENTEGLLFESPSVVETVVEEVEEVKSFKKNKR